MNHREFSEVFVDRHDDLGGVKGAAEDVSIAWVFRPAGDGLDVMTSRRENSRGPSPDARVEEHLHGGLTIGQRRFNALVADETLRVQQAGANVLRLEPGVPFEDCLCSIASSEHSQDMLHGEATSSNDRLAAEDLGVCRDTREKLGFAVHGGDNLRNSNAAAHACDTSCDIRSSADARAGERARTDENRG